MLRSSDLREWPAARAALAVAEEAAASLPQEEGFTAASVTSAAAAGGRRSVTAAAAAAAAAAANSEYGLPPQVIASMTAVEVISCHVSHGPSTVQRAPLRD